MQKPKCDHTSKGYYLLTAMETLVNFC